MLKSFSAEKQTSVHELWAGPEIKLADGVTVTVRSKKERRRFARPVDGEVLDWFRGFQAGDVFYDGGASASSPSSLDTQTSIRWREISRTTACSGS
jgi:hypothetical protein